MVSNRLNAVLFTLAGMLPGAALALVIVLYFWPEPPTPLPPEQIGAPQWLKERVYVDDDTKHEWTRIIIHHSATTGGNLETFHRYHRSKKWGGFAYHFLVGNGSHSKTGQLFSDDGEIEVGYRWRNQEIGAHCKYNNDDSVGICLVGNFQLPDNLPSDAQMRNLARLCAYLSLRYYIPPKRMFFHREMAKANTDCPGKNFPIKEFYRRLQRYIAEYRPYVNQMAGLNPD